jgi:hypothetical protein
MAWMKKAKEIFYVRLWAIFFTHAASVAAKFHIIPHALPFLAPSKKPTTGHADFLGKMLFFYTFHGFW